VLAKLERYELAVFSGTGDAAAGVESAVKRAGAAQRASQVSLFAITNEQLIDELRGLDAASFSAEEAREYLASLTRRVI
jgi:hypothetical protein